MENLNNSFPNYYQNERIFFNAESENYDDKINSSFFKISNLKFYDKQENKDNSVLSPKKKNSLDISYSIEQTFYENSNINIEDEFQNEETFLRIGNEGQKNSIDPIQEVDWFDKENNESFFHENNYFFNNFNENNNNNSIDFQINSSTGVPSELFKFDSLQEKEESELSSIRKNIMSLKQNKIQNANKSDIMNFNNNILRKQIFNVSNNYQFNNLNPQIMHSNNHINNFQNTQNNNNNQNNYYTFNSSSNNAPINNISGNNISGYFNNFYNYSNSNYNNNLNNNNNNNNQIVINLPLFNNLSNANISNNINNNINNVNQNNSNRLTNSNNINNNKLDLSCNNISLNSSFSKRRGRKKLLIDGFKTEIIDKAFLREFRLYLKNSKSLKTLYDDLKNEEKAFWNEFMQNSNPPFIFNINNQKVEFKSFNRNYLKFIFSFNSTRNLYSIFIKEKGKDIMHSILSKKIKQIDKKMALLYNLYGKNLHKLYSDDYNINDLLFEEMENKSYTNIQNSINSICLGDSLVINNANNTSV